MPNWCGNTLRVFALAGHEDDLTSFTQLCLEESQRQILEAATEHFVEEFTKTEGHEPTEDDRAKFRENFTPEPWQQLSAEILDAHYPLPEGLRGFPSGFNGDPEKQAQIEKQQQRNIELYGAKDWYEWCNTHWGTKWGDCDSSLTSSPDAGYAVFSFQSAWGPPSAGIMHISRKWQNLAFLLSYEEGGMGFLGTDAIFRGEAFVVDGDYPEIDWEAEDASHQPVWEEQIRCDQFALYALKTHEDITPRLDHIDMAAEYTVSQ